MEEEMVMMNEVESLKVMRRKHYGHGCFLADSLVLAILRVKRFEIDEDCDEFEE
ncbi:hypothetical protein A2U01_0104779, partial [Trifolium medium]|nr:hypothetical protein [Trifolium medium]